MGVRFKLLPPTVLSASYTTNWEPSSTVHLFTQAEQLKTCLFLLNIYTNRRYSFIGVNFLFVPIQDGAFKMASSNRIKIQTMRSLNSNRVIHPCQQLQSIFPSASLPLPPSYVSMGPPRRNNHEEILYISYSPDWLVVANTGRMGTTL